MKLTIDTGKYIPQPRRYGKLTVDVGEKTAHAGNIVLGSPLPHAQPAERISSPPDSKGNIRRMDSNHLISTGDSLIMKMGQKISLNQKVSDISKILLTLEWELNHSENQRLDLDISVFMTDAAKKTKEEDFIFYNNPISRCGSIRLKEDHGIGVKQSYNEIVQLDLRRVPSYIQTLAVTVTIEADERAQNFGQISKGYLRIIDAAEKKEVLSYPFAEHLSVETAIVITEIYRYKDEWRINAVGSGFKGGLAALCEHYGIEAE
jgi:tellurium resistance protein TerD